ncbi:fumarylacetoacetate hydrolase family protein [Agromyces bracchium]|uniref:Fumarylacetoacetate hydrolase n=1 Tax=Agromyces bracchium TaxID=88376 RepID=A0A6I3M9I5_9MICO|nr:fumarylacetoacetate hydrolase [Agromyces bracchium]
MSKAVHFETTDGKRWIGRLDGDDIVTAGEAPAQGFVPDEAGWTAIVAADGERHALADVHVLAPVAPGKILAIGLNYQAHVEETNLQRPDVPVVFAKLPSSVTGPFDDIVIPVEETRTDYEGELGIVISKRAYRVSEEDAWEYVGGFTALNDVSGRRAQLETPMRQFTLGKSFDTFTPLGPVIASVDSVANRDEIGVKTTIGDEVMQDGNTRQLIFDIPALIEYLTRGVTLEPGDLIATGTPGGVGDERTPPRYLVPGDVVAVEVAGVGAIRNPVRAEDAAASVTDRAQADAA